MHSWIGMLMLAPTVGLLVTGGLSRNWANRHIAILRRWVLSLAILQVLVAACVATGWIVGGGGVHQIAVQTADRSTFLARDFALLINGPSVLMFALVSFIGWVISRYSIRYLDGDANQGRFFKQLALALGGVSLLVWSSSLLMFATAWFVVSMALHPLLLHCGRRPGAKRAAWLKFFISRTGELLLVLSAALLITQFGTTNFVEIAKIAQGANTGWGPTLSACCWLLILAVVLKTAQFPFHAWLPQTLDTPTPVSALMHAGIVNAGGFLMTQTGNWFAWDSSPLVLLTCIGTITAVYGAIVMTTQPTIKQQLAYSTVAQMGFMLLQCGLGAFSAAMLHLIAHSLYKAYAFLASGSVLSDRQATQVTAVMPGERATPITGGLAAQWVLAALLPVGSVTWLMSLASSKAGAVPLLAMWSIAVLFYMLTALNTRNTIAITRSLLLTGVLANGYAISLFAMQKAMPSAGLQLAPSLFSAGVVLAGFATLIAWHSLRQFYQSSSWTRSLYIHALNGFYLEAYWRRWLAVR